MAKKGAKITHATCPSDGGIVDCTVYVAIVQQPGKGRLLQSQPNQLGCRKCQRVYQITVTKREPRACNKCGKTVALFVIDPKKYGGIDRAALHTDKKGKNLPFDAVTFINDGFDHPAEFGPDSPASNPEVHGQA